MNQLLPRTSSIDIKNNPYLSFSMNLCKDYLIDYFKFFKPFKSLLSVTSIILIA